MVEKRICPNCGEKIESDSEFCYFCGEVLNKDKNLTTGEQSKADDHTSENEASYSGSNVSNELISISKLVKWLIIIGTAISTILVWTDTRSSDILRIISVGVLIVLILVAHIISAVLYGFGELIHTNNEILSELRKRK